MSWVHETLAEFGRQMGLPALDFGQHGVAQFVFESGVLLAVEPVQSGEHEEILVYMGLPVGYHGAVMGRMALAKAHHGEAGAMPVQVSLRGDAQDTLLIALVRLPAREFTLQSLGQAVDFLRRWFGSLA